MRSYISNVENKINKRRAMNKEKDKPEDGKVYSLTGAKGTPCIANGNTWKESEVKDDNN
jgi:hypothetical protein